MEVSTQAEPLQVEIAKLRRLFGPDINVIVHGLRSFQSALDDGSVLAFEAVFAPPPHHLKEPRPPFALPPLIPHRHR